MRGRPSEDGATNVARNGYHYTKQNGKFRLTHHIIIENKLGRPLTADEQVYFKDKDKTNLHPDNIAVRPKHKSTDHKRLAQLKARRNELDAEIKDLERKLGA